MQVLKPKTAIKKTKSSQKISQVAARNTRSWQRKMQKICEVSTVIVQYI